MFDGVDVRSEGLVDQFVSTFEQVNLTFEHRFNDSFKISGLAGRSNSIWDGPMRLQTLVGVFPKRCLPRLTDIS